VYKVEREQVGEIITYIVYKKGELTGKYQIAPRQEDGAVCFGSIYSPDANEPELDKEWNQIVEIIWTSIKTQFGERVHGFGLRGWVEQPAASDAASPIAPAVVPQVTRIEHADTVQVFEAGSQQINKAQTGNVNIMSDNDTNIGRDVAGRDKKESTQVGKREADE